MDAQRRVSVNCAAINVQRSSMGSVSRKSIDRHQIIAMTQRLDAVQLSGEIGISMQDYIDTQQIAREVGGSERMVLAQSKKCSFATSPSKDESIMKGKSFVEIGDSMVKQTEANEDNEEGNQEEKKVDFKFTEKDLEEAVHNSQQADIVQPTTKPQSRLKKSYRGAQQYKFAVFSGNYPQYIRDSLADREGSLVQWVELEPTVDSIQMCDFIWKPFNFAKFGFDMFDRRALEIPKRPIIYNHFENIHIISTKTGLLETLKDYYHNTCKEAIEAKYRVQDTLPMAYIITSIPGDHEFNEFKKKFKQIDRGYYLNERMGPKHMQQNFWLLKPSNLNQGKGIEIFNSLKQVTQYLQCKSSDLQWVVQKYIEKPLLYHKRKFDIRVLALATNEMELFFYKIGYMRTSSDEYSLSNQNKFVHLTNNCYQKNSNNYERFEEGNQLSFEQFQNYLDVTFPDLKVSFNDHILPRIKDLVIDCFVAAIGGLNPNKRENCFELMGYDFMIDEDFRVWLIEVNTNPYFGVVNNQLPNFIANLVDDTFKLTIDKQIQPGYEKPFRSDNLYELMYSQTQGINKRRPFTESLYPVPAVKEQLDRERETMLALKFPGMKNAGANQPVTTGGNGETKTTNAPAGSLPTLVKSAGHPPKIHQSNAGNSIQAQGMVVVGGVQPQSKNQYHTLENGESSTSQNFNRRPVLSRGDKASIINNGMVPQTGQSTRSKVSLSITKDNSYTPQLDDQSKKKTMLSKYKNILQSEDRTKQGAASLNKRRTRIVRIEPINNNSNSTSLGRIYNREQSLTMVSQSQNGMMAQRRGTTPAINQEQTDQAIPENDGQSPNEQQSPRRSTMSKLNTFSMHNSNTHGNNLSALLRKKADDKIQNSQQTQNEYLNKIQKMLKVKSLLDQVKDSLVQVDSYEQKRKDFSKIFGQICHIFTNPDGTGKKEVQNAIQALRMMIYSQFIIHFNDKSVLTKLLDILKQTNSSQMVQLEIRESILKNLTEISKHYSIRAALLNRKLFSKIMKSMYEHLQQTLAKHHTAAATPISPTKKLPSKEEGEKENAALVEGAATPETHSRKMAIDESKKSLERALTSNTEAGRDQMDVKVLQNYVSLIITLGSVTNTKFYIPGETKEVETLRRKAIMNGILAFVQAIIHLIIGSGDLFQSGITDAMKRLQYELLETVDAAHFRLHLYTVHSIIRQRVNSMKPSEENPQIQIEKEKLQQILEQVANERLFNQLKITLEHQFGGSAKGLKIKVPSFIEQLDHFLTGQYLVTTFNRYKKIIEYNVSTSTMATVYHESSPQKRKAAGVKLIHKPTSATMDGKDQHKTKELLESQLELLQQNLNQQYQRQASKFVKLGDSRIVGKPISNTLFDGKINSRANGSAIPGYPEGMDIGRSQTQYCESVEKEVPDNNSSLNQTPEILGGIDFNEINSQGPDQKQLTEFVAQKLPVASSNFARNQIIGSSQFVKSNTHISEKAINIGIGRTISSEHQAHSPLVLPSLDSAKKPGKDGVAGTSMYFMKLQPYLKSTKITTRVSVPKRANQNHLHQNNHMTILNQAYGTNGGSSNQMMAMTLQKKPDGQLGNYNNQTGSQINLGNHVAGNSTQKSYNQPPNPNQYTSKGAYNNQGSLLKRQKNNTVVGVASSSNTTSSSKMMAKNVTDSMKNEQTKSMDLVKDDPYSQQAPLQRPSLQNQTRIPVSGSSTSDKKKLLAPLLQQQQQTPKNQKPYKLLSVNESITNAIQITENDDEKIIGHHHYNRLKGQSASSVEVEQYNNNNHLLYLSNILEESVVTK